MVDTLDTLDTDKAEKILEKAVDAEESALEKLEEATESPLEVAQELGVDKEILDDLQEAEDEVVKLSDASINISE